MRTNEPRERRIERTKTSIPELKRASLHHWISEEHDVNLLALNDALQRLEALDPQKSRVVELRYFGGLTIEETAEALKVTPARVKRDWNMARAWLRIEISNE